MKKRKRFKHLCKEERFVIERMLSLGIALRYIARVLGRSPNTISSEIKRNMVNGEYVADKASHKSYVKRKCSKNQCLKVAMDTFLAHFVTEKLKILWSPKQISGYLKLCGIRVSAKAIYKFADKRALDHLLFWSWNKKKSGRKQYSYKQPKDDRKYIDERPVLNELGHFELDFIVSKHNSFVLLVVVDRLSKYTKVVVLPNRKRATVNSAFSSVFSGVLVKSITTDNDIAFSHWKELETLINAPIYFTHPYHSWEKGLVENTNRWIRCFVPKRRDIETVTKEDLDKIHSFLNDRPREVIGFRFPSLLNLEATGCPI